MADRIQEILFMGQAWRLGQCAKGVIQRLGLGRHYDRCLLHSSTFGRIQDSLARFGDKIKTLGLSAARVAARSFTSFRRCCYSRGMLTTFSALDDYACRVASLIPSGNATDKKLPKSSGAIQVEYCCIDPCGQAVFTSEARKSSLVNFLGMASRIFSGS